MRQSTAEDVLRLYRPRDRASVRGAITAFDSRSVRVQERLWKVSNIEFPAVAGVQVAKLHVYALMLLQMAYSPATEPNEDATRTTIDTHKRAPSKLLQPAQTPGARTSARAFRKVDLLYTTIFPASIPSVEGRELNIVDRDLTYSVNMIWPPRIAVASAWCIEPSASTSALRQTSLNVLRAGPKTTKQSWP